MLDSIFCCFSASSGGGGQARRVDVDVTVHGLLARGLQPHLGNGLLKVRVRVRVRVGLGVSAQLLPYYLPTCSRPRLLASACLHGGEPVLPPLRGRSVGD